MEIRTVFNTNLPALSRHLDNEQREYFWDFLSNHWKDMVEHHDKVDLVYLVARRLAQTLRSNSIRAFVEKLSQGTQKPSECKSDEKKLPTTGIGRYFKSIKMRIFRTMYIRLNSTFIHAPTNIGLLGTSFKRHPEIKRITG